jgi:ubiquitin carboxyl-terminal hydrolase 7
MNSLLQSLFHLPAFRRLVFRLPTTGAEDSTKSIPLNLQRLFARLQTSSVACSTTDFTTSLGWGSAETIIQHDVQEFGRVLMDNLEGKLRGTEIENAIADLFRGVVSHTVRCLNVPYVSSREEKFYELTIQVQGCANLAESFAKYIEKEMLTGENQYSTETDGRQDAEMGVDILKLPVILQLHLARFTYDMQTFRPIKITSKFEFPLEFDAGPFVRDGGKLVYELFGVFVHAGGTLGGHYYAYLRPTPALEFFRFNDALVTRETLEQAIDDNFGGVGKMYSAYMLLYVQQSEIPKVFETVREEEFPAHVRDYCSAIEAEIAKQREDLIRQTLFSDVAVGLEADIAENITRGLSGFRPATERVIALSKDLSISGLYEQLSSQYAKIPEDIRIWDTNYQRVPARVVIPSDETTVGALSLASVFIQFKDVSDPVAIDPSQVVVWVKFFHQNEERIEYIASFATQRGAALAGLIPAIAAKLDLPVGTDLWLFHEAAAGPLDLAQSPEAQGVDMGSILIAQHPPSRDPGPPAAPRISPSREPIDGLIPVEYRDVFPDERPTTVEAFLSASADMMLIDLFNMDESSGSPLALLHVSSSLEFTRLKRMIASLLHLDYTPERDAMVLYRVTDPKTRATSQLDTTSAHPTIARYAIPPRPLKRAQFLFEIIEGTNEELFANSSRYTVQFSRDGVHVDTDTKVLAPKVATCREIFEAMGIECDFGNLRYARVFNHKLDQIIPETAVLTNLHFSLRVDVIPEDQRNEADYKYLIAVAYGYMQTGSLVTKAKGYPFFFPVLDGELFSKTKERLIAAIGWESGEEVTYRFIGDALGSETVIGDDIVLSEIGDKKSQLLVISKEDTKPIYRRLKPLANEPVRIYN